MTTFKRPKLHRTFRGIVKGALSRWTTPVWLMVIVAAGYMYARGAYLAGMPGVVDSIIEPVAPVETARLMAIHVKPGDRVKAGQPVATMDVALLDAQSAVDEAGMLETEIDVARYQQGMLQVQRQFQLAQRDAETALATTRLNLGRDTAELEALKVELKRRMELLAKRLIAETELADLKPRIAALEQAIASYPALLKSLEGQAADARRNLEDVNGWLQAGGTTNTAEAILRGFAERKQLLAAGQTMRRLQKEGYVLRSGSDGVVTEVLHVPGVIVPAGDPVVRVVHEITDRVSGFLPETHLHGVKVGDRMIIFPRGERKILSFRATVESVSPEVASLPTRLSPINSQPVRGRRVILKLEGDTDLLPGETVEIRSEENMWARWRRLWNERKAGQAAAAPAAPR